MRKRVLNLLLQESRYVFSGIKPSLNIQLKNPQELLNYYGLPGKNDLSPTEALGLGRAYLDKGLIRAALETLITGLLFKSSPEEKEGLLTGIAWLYQLQKKEWISYVFLSLAQVYSSRDRISKIICDRAALLAQCGRLVKAHKLFGVALNAARTGDDKRKCILGLASLALADQNWQDALDLVDTVEVDISFFPRVQFIKARAYLGMGWLNDARRELERMEETDSKNCDGNSRAHHFIIWGQLHALAGRFEEALLCFAKAIDCILLEPIFLDESLLWQVSWNLAQLHQLIGESDVAVIHLWRAHRLKRQEVNTENELDIEWDYTIGSLSRFSRFAPLLEVLDLVTIQENKIPYAKFRSDRVAHYSKIIADQLGIIGEERVALIWGAKLHDIGNREVPLELFYQKQPFTDEQWKIMKNHTRIDQTIISKLKEVLPGSIDVISMHHERLDGTGYPEGLQANHIPIGPRICALAQAYDALTTPRAFRSAYNHEMAVKKLEQLANGYLDLDLVKVFMNLHTDCENEVNQRNTPPLQFHLPYWTAVGSVNLWGGETSIQEL